MEDGAADDTQMWNLHNIRENNILTAKVKKKKKQKQYWHHLNQKFRGIAFPSMNVILP